MQVAQNHFQWLLGCPLQKGHIFCGSDILLGIRRFFLHLVSNCLEQPKLLVRSLHMNPPLSKPMIAISQTWKVSKRPTGYTFNITSDQKLNASGKTNVKTSLTGLKSGAFSWEIFSNRVSKVKDSVLYLEMSCQKTISTSGGAKILRISESDTGQEHDTAKNTPN